MRIAIEMEPAPEHIRAELRRLRISLRDWRPVWRQLFPLVHRGLAANIRSSGATLGVGWPALSDATLARRKRSKASGTATMIATGALLRSLESGRGRRVKRSITKSRMTFGPRETHPYVQHFGGRKVPARPFLWWPESVRKQAYLMRDAHIASLLASAAARMERS